MAHGADKLVKEQLRAEFFIKVEMREAPCTAQVDIEIDVNHLKQEPGLVQFVKTEPLMFVKEELLGDSSQGTDEQQGVPAASTPPIVGRTSVAADRVYQGQLLNIKEELESTDLGIEPTVHIDSHYGTNQTNLNPIKQEITIQSLYPEQVISMTNDSQIVHSQVKDDAIESRGKNNAALAQCNSKPGVGQPQVYGCKICKQIFKCQLNLSKHTKELHGGEDGQRFSCDKCLQVCKSKHGLWQHSNRVHGTGSHKCTQCDKEFKCKEYLINHVRNAHSEQRQECDVCKKMYKSRAVLRNHISSFHRYRFADPEDGNYRCDKCMKTFQSKIVLKRHCKDTHATGQYKCTECNKEYRCMRYLRIHINSVHTNQEFECDICKKIFQSRLTISRHILRLHSHRLPDLQPCLLTFPKNAVVSTSAQQHKVGAVKSEPADAELELGPVVFQHMDSNYRPYKERHND